MTSVSPTREGYRADLRALTSLRGFLALGVVLFHYQLQWDPALGFSPIIERSRLAVDAFFMLSGFILAHVYGPSFAAGTSQLQALHRRAPSAALSASPDRLAGCAGHGAGRVGVRRPL